LPVVARNDDVVHRVVEAGPLERHARDYDAWKSTCFPSRQQRQQILRADMTLEQSAGRPSSGRTSDGGRVIDATTLLRGLGFSHPPASWPWPSFP
jgi:hypothetical protein